LGTHACQNVSVCNNSFGSYFCECVTGYMSVDATRQKCKNIDECTSGTHACGAHASCLDTIGSYLCKCRQPGRPVSTEDFRDCLDWDECLIGVSNCHQSAVCNSECVSVYVCTCACVSCVRRPKCLSESCSALPECLSASVPQCLSA